MVNEICVAGALVGLPHSVHAGCAVQSGCNGAQKDILQRAVNAAILNGETVLH